MGIFNPLFRTTRKAREEWAGWVQAGPQDLPGVELALRNNEAMAMNLLDAFFRLQPGRVPPGNKQPGDQGRKYLQPWKNDWWNHFLVRRDPEGQVLAILAFGSSGYLYSLAACPGQEAPEIWTTGFALLQHHTPRFNSRLFGSILHHPASESLLPGLLSRIRSRTAYKILKLDCGSPARTGWMPAPTPEFRDESLAPGLYLRSGTPLDARLLLDIQCAYEEEEVLCAGQTVDPGQSLARLEHLLRKHRIYLACQDGQAVAKAGTNALSWNYVQIGGVYTKPALRNRGIARELMGLVLDDALSCGLGACLFVKAVNVPALKVYTRLGFETCGGIDITYYR